jgi:hypothetical protein
LHLHICILVGLEVATIDNNVGGREHGKLGHPTKPIILQELGRSVL